MQSLELLIKPASSLCNMRCDYCFYADLAARRETPSFGRMSEQTLARLVDRAFAEATDRVVFAFQGGEPTLAGLPFFRRFAALVRERNTRGIEVIATLQTNGLLIDEAWADFLAEEDFLVGVSLDGPACLHDLHRADSEGRGTGERVLAALDRLAARRVKVNILAVVTAETARRPAEVYDALRRFGHLQFIPCMETADCAAAPSPEDYAGFLSAAFARYAEDLARRPVSVRYFDNLLMILLGGEPELCPMRGGCTPGLVIEADGSVYPCDFYADDRHRLGDLSSASFSNLLASPAARRFAAEAPASPPECARCRWFSLCRGGCRRNRIAGRDRYCAAYRAFFERHFAKLVQIAREIGENEAPPFGPIPYKIV